MTEVLTRLFLAGFVRLHILHHAAADPICGVEIALELARHGYRLSPGTIYPALHELAQAGFLTMKNRVVQGKRRKYYRATGRGRKALATTRKLLRELADEVLHEGGERP